MLYVNYNPIKQGWGSEKKDRNLLANEQKPSSFTLAHLLCHQSPRGIYNVGTQMSHWPSSLRDRLLPPDLCTHGPHSSGTSFCHLLQHHLLCAGTGFCQAADDSFGVP